MYVRSRLVWAMMVLCVTACFGLVGCGDEGGSTQTPDSGEHQPPKDHDSTNDHNDSMGAYTDAGDTFHIADSPVRGEVDALVTIVEFGDFQCSYCGEVEPILQSVVDDYVGRVRLVFKNFPLSFHEHARGAAEAARAAMLQDSFWPYHDFLFEHQDDLASGAYVGWAEGLGLDSEAFAADVQSEAVKNAVQADIDLGESLGVSGTPTIFINGYAMGGVHTEQEYGQVIEDEKVAMEALIAAGDTPSEALTARIEENLAAR